MATPVFMPQVGQDLTEGKIVALRIKVGDKVAKGDIVAEVESEKATFEVEAFVAGVVVDVLYKVGDTAEVLKPLLFLDRLGNGVERSKTSRRLRNRFLSPRLVIDRRPSTSKPRRAAF